MELDLQAAQSSRPSRSCDRDYNYHVMYGRFSPSHIMSFRVHFETGRQFYDLMFFVLLLNYTPGCTKIESISICRSLISVGSTP